MADALGAGISFVLMRSTSFAAGFDALCARVPKSVDRLGGFA